MFQKLKQRYYLWQYKYITYPKMVKYFEEDPTRIVHWIQSLQEIRDNAETYLEKTIWQSMIASAEDWADSKKVQYEPEETDILTFEEATQLTQEGVMLNVTQEDIDNGNTEFERATMCPLAQACKRQRIPFKYVSHDGEIILPNDTVLTAEGSAAFVLNADIGRVKLQPQTFIFKPRENKS